VAFGNADLVASGRHCVESGFAVLSEAKVAAYPVFAAYPVYPRHSLGRRRKALTRFSRFFHAVKVV
jgi:hypothetical protein